MTDFNVQQKATIDNYRSTHKLGFVVTDEYIAELIKKEMEQTGVIYAGFESLAKSVAKSHIKQPTQTTNANAKTNSAVSIFGTQIVDNEFDLGFSGKTTNTYPEIQPTESQSEAINFLKDLTNEAETSFKNREADAGALSTVVNTWHEILKDQYAKSNVKKELQAAKEDLQVLEQASKGQVGYTDFLGDTHIRSFEDVFKQRRGVKFDKKAIADCTEKAEQFSAIKTSVEMINQTKQILGYTTKGDVHSQMNPQEASSAIIKAFQLSGINSLEEMNKTLQDIEQKYKNHPDIQKYGGGFKFAKNKQGQYVIYRIAKNGYPAEATNEQLRIVTKEMGLRLDKALATALGVEYSESATLEEMANLTQQTYDKYQKEYEESFAKAYGKKDVKALAEAYVLKQQQGVANIEMALNIASMALMVVPGGIVGTSGLLLKGSKLVQTAQKMAKVGATLTEVSQVASPFVMATMTLRPTELLEQLTSKNGMSVEEWKAWGQGVLQNSIYMAAGMGASKIAQNGAAMYKTKALVNSLKSAGKSTDDIVAMVKANPLKFPNEIAKNFSRIDNLAKALQVTSEVALDLGSTIALNKVMNNGDILPMDVVNSIAFAIMGGVVQKDIARLNGNVDKIDFIVKEFKEFGVTEADAKNILQAMDDISLGKIDVNDIKPLGESDKSPQAVDGKPLTNNLTKREKKLLASAVNDNPAPIVAEKIKQQWLESGLQDEVTSEPLNLFNLDPYAGLKEPIQEISGEVTSLILKNKLVPELSNKYQYMEKDYEKRTKKYYGKFIKIAQKYKNDEVKIAKEIVRVFSKEFGLEGFEPPIKISLKGNGYGEADFDGIKLAKNFDTLQDMFNILSHEFIHMLQYRDIIVKYGENGIKDIINSDPTKTKEQKTKKIEDTLNNNYVLKMLHLYKKRNIEQGTIDDYLTRVYKDEMINIVDPDVDFEGYIGQAMEREAYYLGSGAIGEFEGAEKLNKFEFIKSSSMQGNRPKIRTRRGFLSSFFRPIKNDKITIDNRINELCKKYNDYGFDEYSKSILAKFDYENAEIHLRNLKMLLQVPSNSFSRVIETGYFSSEEGIRAIEIASQYYDLKPKQAGFVSPLCSILSTLTPQEIITLEKRKLFNSNCDTNASRMHLIAKMSDAEYDKFILDAQKSIKSTGKSYDELKQELFNLITESGCIKYKHCLEDAYSVLGTEEAVVAQIEILKVLENTALKLDDYSFVSFLSKINMNNSTNVKNILDILLTKPNLQPHQLNSIIGLTNKHTEKILIDLLKIDDLPINKILEILGHNDDFVNGKLTKEVIMEKVNNDSYIKIVRAIKGTTTELGFSSTKITTLNPTNIEASSLALVHMTKYEPTDGMILSTRDKLGGSRNSVHFTLNHAVTSHRAGDWEDCSIAIIMPYSSTVQTNSSGKFIEGMPNDLYTNGSVKIPEGSVIVKHNNNLPEGTINIVEHPTIKGVKLVETSMLPHDITPTVLEKMGYSRLQGDAPLGLFNHGTKNGNSIDDIMQNYEAWNNFCKTQGIKPARHTGTPGAIAEGIIENIGKLNVNGSWVANSGTNYKKSIIKSIEILKKWENKGYFISYDIEALSKIIQESPTPNHALKRMQSELNIHPTVDYQTFYESSLDDNIDIYEEWLNAVEDPITLRKYVIERELRYS